MEYSVHAQLFETRLPAGLIDVSHVGSWCPSCFRGGQARPEVAQLPEYLTALAAWYASTGFQVHGGLAARGEPSAASAPEFEPAVRRAIAESAYLREVFRVPEPPRLARRDGAR
jgi:hypothetical protein